MMRFTPIVAIFLTAAFAATLANLHSASWSQPTISRFDDNLLPERTRERIVTYRSFKSTLTTTIDLLAAGKIRLEDAAARVYESALHHNPGYLRHIATCERGATPLENVARNLIGHVSSLGEINPTIQARAFALEIEFAEMQRRSGLPQF